MTTVPPTAPTTTPTRAPTTVLIADDQPDLLAILAARFAAHGFQALTAPDGAEALRLARARRPDAVVLDVMMPELNGYQVCRAIKGDPQLAATAVLLLTVKSSDADRFWGAEVGADRYLTKPADPRQVVAAVAELLGRPDA